MEHALNELARKKESAAQSLIAPAGVVPDIIDIRRVAFDARAKRVPQNCSSDARRPRDKADRR
jgi:hypothetical protein